MPLSQKKIFWLINKITFLRPTTLIQKNHCLREYVPFLRAITNKLSLRNEKLKTNKASETEEQRKERLRIWCENKKTENHEKLNLSNLKRLKGGEINELERNLRLEKVIDSKQLRLAVKTEEERRARIWNDAATNGSGWPWRRTKNKKARLEKMLATGQLMLALIKVVVDVGEVLSL